MTQPKPRRLFSDQWYRIRDLKVQLAPTVAVRCQLNRGQRWYVVSMAGQNRRIRLNESAYAIVGRCDGSETLEAVFRTMLRIDPEGLPTQDEIIELVSKLVADGYLHCQQWPQLENTFDQQRDKVSKQTRQRDRCPRRSLYRPCRIGTESGSDCLSGSAVPPD